MYLFLILLNVGSLASLGNTKAIEGRMMIRVCNSHQEGWVISPDETGGGYLYCDILENPCSVTCEYTKGIVPSHLTLDADQVYTGGKLMPHSTCLEQYVPGGLQFVPAKCTGSKQGCLVHLGRIIYCTQIKSTIEFPLEVYFVSKAQTPEYLIIFNTAIIIVLSLLLTFYSLIMIYRFVKLKKWKPRYYLDIGSNRRIQLDFLDKLVQEAEFVGRWSNGKVIGTLTYTFESTNQQCRKTPLIIRPEVGYIRDDDEDFEAGIQASLFGGLLAWKVKQ